jgi:hypothetical protein
MKGAFMITRNISLPEIGLIAGTRMALGAGLGLLLADQFKPQQRRAIGRTLVAIGVLSTIPLAVDVLLRHGGSDNNVHPDADADSAHEDDLVSSRSTL